MSEGAADRAPRQCRRPSPFRRAQPASPPSDRSCTAVAVPSRISARTKSPFSRSSVRSTGGGAPSSRPQISRRYIDWPSQPVVSPTSKIVSSGRFEGERRRCREIVDQADAADGRRRQDRASVGLVVERDIAGHDREIERLAGFGDATNAADELPHDLRPLRIAEIEIVGDGERPRADRGEIAPAFGDRLLAALERIGLAVARRHVGGEREALRPILDTHHRGIAARPLHRVAENDVVILLPHPTLRAEIRRRQQFLQRLADADRRLDALGVDFLWLRRGRRRAACIPAPGRRVP